MKVRRRSVRLFCAEEARFRVGIRVAHLGPGRDSLECDAVNLWYKGLAKRAMDMV